MTDYDSRRTGNWFSDRGSTPLRSIEKSGNDQAFSFCSFYCSDLQNIAGAGIITLEFVQDTSVYE